MLRIACLVLLVACAAKPAPQSPGLVTTPPGGAASGTLTGTVSFVGTACQDPAPPPCDGVYPNYEVVVHAADGKTVAGKAKTGADGTYSLTLPAGTYVLFTEPNRAVFANAEPTRHEVTVHRDALTTLDLAIDTGVR